MTASQARAEARRLFGPEAGVSSTARYGPPTFIVWKRKPAHVQSYTRPGPDGGAVSYVSFEDCFAKLSQ